jgi:Uma2 family endonuclease
MMSQVIEVVERHILPDLPDSSQLPEEDGVPLETNWHRSQMNLLIDVVRHRWRDHQDFFAGGNMFVYYSLEQAPNRDYRGPDFFVVKGVDRSRQRRSWIVWQEGGRYPDVIIELLSLTTAEEDLGPKKNLYEQVFKTFEYFCVNPDGHTLQGWRLVETRYVPLQPNERGWLWAESLQLWLGFQEGSFQGTQDIWVRFFEASGALVPTSGEVAAAERKRAEAERARADAVETENARLRAELEQLRHT